MIVAVDARPAAFPHRTGVGHYTWQLLRLLPRVDPGTRYVAWYLHARALLGGRVRLFPEAPPSNLTVRWTPFPSRWFERLSARLDLPRVEWFVRFDVLFAPNFVPPPTRARRVVLTVHDLAFRILPETAPQATRAWLARLDRALRRASRVLVPSEATRRDLLEHSPVPEEVVRVVPEGVDRAVFHPASPQEVTAARRRFGVDGPYLLYLGGIEPRKNLPTLVRAFARLPRDLDVRLVVAGSWVAWNPEGVRGLEEALAGLPAEARARVVRTGYVADPDRRALLTGAEAFVFPSRYEGFGLPVLEAMACGTPVVTSNLSALPEVAGEAALLVDPLDEEALAQAVERVLRDRELRERLRAVGLARVERFSWEETARRTAQVLHEA